VETVIADPIYGFKPVTLLFLSKAKNNLPLKVGGQWVLVAQLDQF
jgi:hypothetical protein